jgi:hypothetical protein
MSNAKNIKRNNNRTQQSTEKKKAIYIPS